jgi:tRNA threonylcarbamoyladenosine biosynthesis protein TsaE
MDYISKSPRKTWAIGREIASRMVSGGALCLYGELGAGKTTFVHGFIDYFLPGKRVISPTFIIVRHYPVSHRQIKNIYHVDLYRIAKENEISTLGVSEWINRSDSLVLIEWAQKLGDLLPKKRIDVRFEIKTEKERVIELYE